MPWKGQTMEEQREEFVRRVENLEQSKRALCRVNMALAGQPATSGLNGIKAVNPCVIRAGRRSIGLIEQMQKLKR